MVSKIYLDYDNTLVDHVFKYLEWVKEITGNDHDTRDLVLYDTITNIYGYEIDRWWMEPGCYDVVSPFNGAQRFVNCLKNLVGHDNVLILTSTPSKVMGEKTRHIMKHFNMHPDNIIHSHSKWDHSYDGVLVDDYKIHIIDHLVQNKNPGVLFTNESSYGWSRLNEDDEKKIFDVQRSLYTATNYDQAFAQIVEILESPNK